MDKNKPEVVPDRLDSPINYKIVLAIIGGTTAFHYLVNLMGNEDDSAIISSIVFIITPAITGLVSLSISRRYRQEKEMSKVLSPAYLALAIAYLASSGGELMYFIYDYVIGESPYPSLADVFFVVFYPLVLTHLLLNITFFRPKFNIKNLPWMIPLPIGIVALYLALLQSEVFDFLFFFSLYYVVISAISLTFTIYGAIIFKDGMLGRAWLLLLYGIIAFSIADVIYYNIEVVGGYDLAHPVNLLWYAGYWIITYALYKHRKTL